MSTKLFVFREEEQCHIRFRRFITLHIHCSFAVNMSYLSLKNSKMFVACLPGHKFTIWVGLVVGVMFTSNQSTSAKRRAFRMLQRAYAVLLNLCILTVVVLICNDILAPSSNISPSASHIVGQGLNVFYAVMVVAYRLYLLMIAAPLSSLVRNLKDSGTFSGSKLSSFKFWVTSLISVYFATMTWALIWLVGFVVESNNGSPWMYGVINVVPELLIDFIVWSAGSAKFVAFAIVMTTLDRLLDLLEGFIKRVQSIVALASRFGKSRMNRESSGQQQLESILEIEHVLSELQKIQEMFDRYDQLLGPLIFLLLSNSTIGFVDGISEVVQSKVKKLGSRSSFLKCLALFNNLLPFTLLNIGYLAKSKIKYLKTSLKRETAAWMSRSRNEGLRNLCKNIEKWNWEMSAAGFFTVDRSLVTGIASVALTYIVLLFQIQGVLKGGAGDVDQLRQQILRLLTRLNQTQHAMELEH